VDRNHGAGYRAWDMVRPFLSEPGHHCHHCQRGAIWESIIPTPVRREWVLGLLASDVLDDTYRTLFDGLKARLHHLTKLQRATTVPLLARPDFMISASLNSVLLMLLSRTPSFPWTSSIIKLLYLSRSLCVPLSY
jgi:hypothetical protein